MRASGAGALQSSGRGKLKFTRGARANVWFSVLLCDVEKKGTRAHVSVGNGGIDIYGTGRITKSHDTR